MYVPTLISLPRSQGLLVGQSDNYRFYPYKLHGGSSGSTFWNSSRNGGLQSIIVRLYICIPFAPSFSTGVVFEDRIILPSSARTCKIDVGSRLTASSEQDGSSSRGRSDENEARRRKTGWQPDPKSQAAAAFPYWGRKCNNGLQFKQLDCWV